MIRISKDQAYERWDTLPDEIRSALVSETTSDFVWKTCEAEHIPAEKIYDVARVTGYVLFGFLHPEDLASELREALNVDIRITTPIAAAISERIFSPLRPEIDKAYRLPGATPVSLPVGMPKILQETGPIVPVGSLSRAKLMKSPSASVPNLQKIDSGKISVSSPGMPVSASPGRSASPAIPAPFMMQNDAVAKPIEKAPDFHMASDNKIASVSKFTPPGGLSARPAVLEFSGQKNFAPPKPPMPRATDSNNVPVPPSQQAGRKISEITDVANTDGLVKKSISAGMPVPVPMPPKPITPISAQNIPPPVPLPPRKI